MELKRRWEMELKMGADDLPSLMGMLNTLIFDLSRLDDSNLEDMTWPYNQVSGGYSGNHSLTLNLRPDVTHDSYMAALNAYLNSKPAAQEDHHADE